MYCNATLNRLMQLASNNILPHAILLESSREEVAAETCLTFAKFLLCNNATPISNAHSANNAPPISNAHSANNVPPINNASLVACRCRSCTLFDAGTHTDFLCIKPTETSRASTGGTASIKIDDVRTLVDFSQLQPQFSTNKVVVLTGIQYLNANAANALLKTLEEPPQDTVLLLTTTSAMLLLPTIRSRCMVISLEYGPINTINLIDTGNLIDTSHLIDTANLIDTALLAQLRLDLRELLINKTTNILVVAAKWHKQDAIKVSAAVWYILFDLARKLVLAKVMAQKLLPIIDRVTNAKSLLQDNRPINMQLFWEALLLDCQKLQITWDI